MDGAWVARLRWRRRGAWLWPAFITVTAVDAVVGHLLPPAGESETLVAAALMGLLANLIGVILLTRPLGMLVRRFRPDLPEVVARDYGGTVVVLAIAGCLLTAGALHRSTRVAHQQSMRDATVRAQAYIGDRAPAEFRRNVADASTFAILDGSLYRVCVPSADGRRTYCVIVNTRRPFASSVSFSGYEPNWMFADGVG